MMTTVRFRRARSREMRAIVKERAERPINRTMDYGKHWPPKPPPSAARKQPKLKLWQQCVGAVVTFALIWAGGAVAILIVQAAHH